jgi:hypothetical protein
MSVFEATLTMPNPFSRIIPDAELYLDYNILDDKPEMAKAVARIFAVWAAIEHRLRFLLFEVVGSNSGAAVAIYETLTAQHLQRKALENAAKAVLPLDAYSIVLAALSIAESSQTPRNHLAHWLWGGCKQKPDLLALADPTLIKELDLRLQTFYNAKGMVECDGWDPEFLDPDLVLAYSIGDLKRAEKDLIETSECLQRVGSYLWASGANRDCEVNPSEQAHILSELNELRLFREAKAQIDADFQKHPPVQHESLRSRWYR